jgi:hypothetical protein
MIQKSLDDFFVKVEPTTMVKLTDRNSTNTASRTSHLKMNDSDYKNLFPTKL